MMGFLARRYAFETSQASRRAFASSASANNANIHSGSRHWIVDHMIGTQPAGAPAYVSLRIMRVLVLFGVPVYLGNALINDFGGHDADEKPAEVTMAKAE